MRAACCCSMVSLEEYLLRGTYVTSPYMRASRWYPANSTSHVRQLEPPKNPWMRMVLRRLYTVVMRPETTQLLFESGFWRCTKSQSVVLKPSHLWGSAASPLE